MSWIAPSIQRLLIEHPVLLPRCRCSILWAAFWWNSLVRDSYLFAAGRWIGGAIHDRLAA
jgi:hypothetical protein